LDSISTELLKNGGPNKVNALHEMVQQASETPPEDWTTWLCKLSRDMPTERYKVFAKILYDRQLTYTNAVVQHYQAGFQ
jgi:hypothetical protein